MGKIEKALKKTNSIKSLFSKISSSNVEKAESAMEVDNEQVSQSKTKEISDNCKEGDESKTSEKKIEKVKKEMKETKNKKEKDVKEKKEKTGKEKKEKVVKDNKEKVVKDKKEKVIKEKKESDNKEKVQEENKEEKNCDDLEKKEIKSNVAAKQGDKKSEKSKNSIQNMFAKIVKKTSVTSMSEAPKEPEIIEIDISKDEEKVATQEKENTPVKK